MKRRPTATRWVDCWAECQDRVCGWTTTGSGAVGRAARHYDLTGHTIQFHQTLIGRYGSHEVEPEPGDHQEALL